MGRGILRLATATTLAAIGLIEPAAAQDEFIVVQSTTSTRNSGLYDHILPMFFEKTGIEVRVVAVGTGQAIRNAANGDGDVCSCTPGPPRRNSWRTATEWLDTT